MNDLASRPPYASEPDLPPARIKPSRQISLVWLIPLVAAIIAGWLAFTTWRNQGPVIRITFESAEGLEAGTTKIRYRDVDVGTVERVQIGDDLSRIVVTARMVKDADRFLRAGSLFWIVRPRVGTGGVSGLGTLVSGAYMEVDPGGGDYAWEFQGLEEPPQIRSNMPGRSYVLRADNLGSVSRGAPIYYRGIEVGQVLGYDLAANRRDPLRIAIFVRAPYADLVHPQTRFWNASGLSVSTGAGGLSVHMAALQALLVGGLEFETPTTVASEDAASAGAEFQLFADSDDATQAAITHREPFLVEFEGSTRGLHAGAPVEVRGLRIGSVGDVRLAYSRQRGLLLVQAVVEIEPERLQAIDAESGDPVAATGMDEMVSRGLRAQLKTGNLLTGDLYVDLDFIPDSPPETMRQVRDLRVIPSIPTSLETLQASATSIVEKIANLPIPEMVASLNNTVKALEGIAGSPETRGMISNLNETMASLRSTIDTLNRETGPLVTSLKGSSDAATQALRQAAETLESVSPSSRLGSDAQALLTELRSTARSVRGLADYLERNPEALLRGRQGGGYR